MKAYLESNQGTFLITCFYPDFVNFSFEGMYIYVKKKGYAIYPGKLTDAKTFRIGNIGEIFEENMMKVYQIIREFLKGVCEK